MTPTVSFEFFPPKDIAGSFRLWDTLGVLQPFDPAFVSVTYGAGGTTRDLTHQAVTAIGGATGIPVAAHLTCVDATRDETLAIAESYAEAGVRDIVALRGDMPEGAPFEAHPDGFASSVELVEALAATGRHRIRVGAYPERHPDAAHAQADVEFLARKFDAGAHSAITQFFFEAETFLRFRDRCAAAGIDAPIVPGILPVASWSGVSKFAANCGAQIPQTVADGFANAKGATERDLFALAIAAELCDELLSEGVEHLHLYTMNRPDLSRDLLTALGLQPRQPLRDVA
ncbi:MAG: methylenetetrahydrofolate reductase [NAD(P)H] [Paracoccaceae bacterium]